MQRGKEMLDSVIRVAEQWKNFGFSAKEMVAMAEMLRGISKCNCPYQECCDAAGLDASDDDAEAVQLYCMRKRLENIKCEQELWDKVPIDKSLWNSTPEIHEATALLEAINEQECKVSSVVCPLLRSK